MHILNVLQYCHFKYFSSIFQLESTSCAAWKCEFPLWTKPCLKGAVCRIYEALWAEMEYNIHVDVLFTV